MKKIMISINEDGFPMRAFVSPLRAIKFTEEHDTYAMDSVELDEDPDPEEVPGEAKTYKVQFNVIVEEELSNLESEEPLAEIVTKVQNLIEGEVTMTSWEILDKNRNVVNSSTRQA